MAWLSFTYSRQLGGIFTPLYSKLIEKCFDRVASRMRDM